MRILVLQGGFGRIKFEEAVEVLKELCLKFLKR